jgi:carboxylesterase type B
MSGNSYYYDGSHLAETGNVIVVVIHYRVGVLGYLGAD